MFLRDGMLVTSASDLSAASRCEFAVLRRLDEKLGRDLRVPADDDPTMERAARLGDAHEERLLRRARERLGAGVVEIERPATMRLDDLRVRAEETAAAFRAGAGLVFQATFFAEPAAATPEERALPIAFLGFADFLVRTAAGPEGSAAYEVQDAKLARRARVPALMQLGAYAEQLRRIGVPVSPVARLLLGDGSESEHRLDDIEPVFHARRDRLHRLIRRRWAAAGPDGRAASAAPLAWGAADVAACGRCEVCAPEVTAARDLLLVAALSLGQRDRLLAAGVDTIDALARHDPERPVPGIGAGSLGGLVAQARLQLLSAGEAVPRVEVIDPLALAAIPAPNPGDLFFDFEGDPLFLAGERAGRTEWGIDYLFGLVDARARFTALWAHTLAEEKAALRAFLDLVAARRALDPGLRIYHYAAYERSHLLSIAARHGEGEAEVDQLLREHVLVDLYPIVRRALRIGSRSYSIKKLEPLYMGADLRDDAGVTSAGQSISEYADAVRLLAEPDAAARAEGQRRLDAIAEYNEADCRSTLRLRDWLLERAAEHGVRPLAAHEEARDAPPLEESETAAGLARHAEPAPGEPRSAEQTAAALASAAIDYHAREQKSFWWAHFARLADPIEDWAGTRDVLVVDPARSEVVADWHLPDGKRVSRRLLRLDGEAAPGSALRAGEVFAVYAAPAPFPTPGGAPGARGSRTVRILANELDSGGGVLVEETLGRVAGEPLAEFAELPVALTPGSPPPAGAQLGAIREWGQELLDALDRGGVAAEAAWPRNAVTDLLRRRPPRFLGGAEPVRQDSAAALASGGGEDQRLIGAVTESLLALDRSYLAVQGPPGTGKTYLASRVIRALVERHGWKIGVVAQSHRVVENVLAGVVRAGLDPARVGKVAQRGREAEPAPYTVLKSNGQAAFAREHGPAGFVIAGTAWDFANEKRVGRGQLDLLVVDEAAQFSLAPTIAASVAAERLLLLGDPQQLPQVSQGSHPEPVDESALGWLVAGAEVLPAELGYFLAESRRMRPEVTGPVSRLAYGGRLRAHPSASERSLEGHAPGVHTHRVEHRGNATFSPEEAEAVVGIVRGVVGSRWHPGGGAAPRPATEADVIVVAPYNAQVECLGEALAAAGLGAVRVGTVDKFQGQEAAVAILSTAASSPAEVPRGMEFLLMRNRLNVAISRAQVAAHVVTSAHLTEYLPATATAMADLSAFLRLTGGAAQ